MQIIIVRTIVIILIGFFTMFCSRQQDILEQIKDSGELRIVTRDNLTTCYQGQTGPTGFECTLAQRFADELGVRLKTIMVESDRQAIDIIRRGKGHLIAGLKVTAQHKSLVRFGPSYKQIHQKIIYRRSDKRPRNIQDLAGILVEVARNCECMDVLREIDAKDPDFIWREHSSIDTEELLSLVLQRKIDITVADSHEVDLMKQLYPELGVAFSIGEPQSLAWGFPLGTDDSLYVAADLFFEKIKENGEMADITQRYYGHMKRFNYIESRKFLYHVKFRLPKYREYFKTAAIRHGVDWHLLGAIGYQESHWDPKAVSPTGVRGIMMLTSSTAKQLGVKDRTNEKQSIFGGARYFAYLKEKMPKQIEDPDRTWFALASYNVGFGHLEDARILTQRAGANPNRWDDVREFLPLISKKKWYTRTRYGYARGHEPVQFVRKIRRYYDKLIWLDRPKWKNKNFIIGKGDIK
uniref:Membrane-bound lytic murein transglycosylase F n=1 Tax=Candidatus Kentrum sp. TUN TaxID=2126343 RepID=A0A450ZWS0_9GAMM|nr:MAG: membrane-bound lytic murein transglycosylase F [Candidatus Kentron sp. TUN]VFK52436.1 MAG: membrane-bound lytic murein transglycosylase F [Candidatus Kentron sp. TUN]VFK58186.1 MAG: membrane-bound lytic murein transglycosylase F [Candidatus Kentron sp. TUN]